MSTNHTQLPSELLEHHQRQWLERCPALGHGPDVSIYTDGAGWTDGWGASAFMSVFMKHSLPPVTGVNLTNQTVVSRAEFTALLEGLQSVCEALQLPRFKPEGSQSGVTIFWFTDRQDLALSAIRNVETGVPIYRRNNDADLWARYEYYERGLIIFPCHFERNSIPLQKLMDKLASDGRRKFKEWFNQIIEKHNAKS